MPEMVKGEHCKCSLCGFESYWNLKYCGVEQRPARQAHNLKVGGSNPSPVTNIRCHTAKFGICMTFNYELTLRHLFLMLFICK